MLGTSSYGRRNRYVGSSTTAPAAANPGTYLARPRLPLRSYLKPKSVANLSNLDSVGYGRSKRLRSRKINGFQKMDGTKKKSPDYTEVAYREAVSKLKYLLAESYAPRMPGSTDRSSNLRMNESGDDTDDRSIASENSHRKTFVGNFPSRTGSYLSRPRNIHLAKACSNLALASGDQQSVPPELTSFIERQEEYIEQLEKESQYCRDELTNLLGKVREVVAENEALQGKNKNSFLKSVIEEYKNSEEENNDPEDFEVPRAVAETKGKRVKLQKILEGPSIVFESRISELEAQLTQARVELRKAHDENQANLKRLTEGGAGDGNPELKAQLELAQREKREAEMKVQDLQRSLTATREREADTAHKGKRALDLVEQAQFEKTQAEAEIRRLREELDRQHEKLREAAQDASRRIAEERHQIERRYSQQVEQLSADIASHWDTASKSQLESEKQRRELADLRRDLAQKNALIDDLKKELQSKISSLQSDLSQAIAEKDAAEQEVSAAKLAAERAERQARQEQSRSQAEINSYKQRLERADADLVHCRRENLRLSEQIASLEKEIGMNKMIRVDETRTSAVTPRPETEKELTSMIMDVETKHEGVVERDAGTISMTASPPNKNRTVKVDLKVKVIPKKKSSRSDTSKEPLPAQEEMANLQSNIEYLSSKIQETINSRKDTSHKAATQPTIQDHGIISSYEQSPVNQTRYNTRQIEGGSTHVQREGYQQPVEEQYRMEGNRETNYPLEHTKEYINPQEQHEAADPQRYAPSANISQTGATLDVQDAKDYDMHGNYPTDGQNYESEYANQEYNQEYNQEFDQYDSKQHEQGEYADDNRYKQQGEYPEMQYSEQEYQNYQEGYDDKQNTQESESKKETSENNAPGIETMSRDNAVA